MRTLLRHALTGQYYRSFGKWTANPNQAHDFKTVGPAMALLRNTKSPHMEINLWVDTTQKPASFTLGELCSGF